MLNLNVSIASLVPRILRRRSKGAPRPLRPPPEFPLRLLEVFWLALVAGLAVAHVARFVALPETWSWSTLLLVGLAALAADFVSGCIHWFFDTWGSNTTPFFGPRLVRPFRHHHDKPNDLLQTHFITTSSDSALAFLPFLLAAFCFPLGNDVTRSIGLFVAAVGVWGLPTSQIHKWAHSSRVPWWVAGLQRCRMILGPVHHGRHHAAPHTVNYCITTGWCNGLLNRIAFFPRMERLISALTGLRPRQDELPAAPFEQHASERRKVARA